MVSLVFGDSQLVLRQVVEDEQVDAVRLRISLSLAGVKAGGGSQVVNVTTP
jgi:hypothetical protein